MRLLDLPANLLGNQKQGCRLALVALRLIQPITVLNFQDFELRKIPFARDAKVELQHRVFRRDTLLVEIFPELRHVVGMNAEDIDRLQAIDKASLGPLART